MNKTTASKYKAIVQIHNLTLSNNINPKDIMINLGIGQATYYKAIQYNENYYTSIINQIEADQKKVIRLKRKGYSNKSISQIMNVSQYFVKDSRKQIYEFGVVE